MNFLEERRKSRLPSFLERAGIAMANVFPQDSFRQSELDKFDQLAQRWWGEAVRSRTTGSRDAERPCMDARAGATRHGWLGGIA
jgi:hypothetical protein